MSEESVRAMAQDTVDRYRDILNGLDDEPKEGERRTMECPSCHTVKECIFEPDPYAADIGGDFTPVWECADCRYESAMDI